MHSFGGKGAIGGAKAAPPMAPFGAGVAGSFGGWGGMRPQPGGRVPHRSGIVRRGAQLFGQPRHPVAPDGAQGRHTYIQQPPARRLEVVPRRLRGWQRHSCACKQVRVVRHQFGVPAMRAASWAGRSATQTRDATLLRRQPRDRAEQFEVPLASGQGFQRRCASAGHQRLQVLARADRHALTAEPSHRGPQSVPGGVRHQPP